MRIIYNGIEQEIEQESNLGSWLKSEGLTEKQGIAVAINETVVPRMTWPDYILKPNDTILVIRATQGG